MKDELHPQLFFDRARASVFELLKLLVTLSTAGVAVYFALLTRAPDPQPQPGAVQTIALVALACLAGAAFTGIVGWIFDAYYYDQWAHSLENTTVREHHRKVSHLANRVRFWAVFVAVALFVGGVVLSGVYAISRK